MRRLAFLAPALLAIAAVGVGCSAPPSGAKEAGAEEGAFSSLQATLFDFELDSTLVTDGTWSDKQTIQDQLLYTIGHLNQQSSVGRLDNLELSNITKKTLDDGLIEISYHAKLPVAWGNPSNLPTRYDFKLPKDVSAMGQEAFTEAHKASCVDRAAHAVDPGSMWYYYRPDKADCVLSEDEIVRATATATRSALNTTRKYPEYHKVWEDDRLEVISIFGKFDPKAGRPEDAGISAFNGFVRMMKNELRSTTLVTTPADVGDAPGPNVKDVTLEGTLPDGKTVKISALLVDDIVSTGPDFDARYESLSPSADLIAYNGHAGLGQNVRVLAKKGRWAPSKYQIFFMNGCDTFAYVDGSLAQTRALLNSDDPGGTKYMEFVTNAMPSFFSSMPAASTALTKGLMSYAEPKTYEEIFEGIDRAEVVLVTGEEDNDFRPGMKIGSR
jgi:hypothetical protein